MMIVRYDLDGDRCGIGRGDFNDNCDAIVVRCMHLTAHSSYNNVYIDNFKYETIMLFSMNAQKVVTYPSH
jgi:hypothetical protein